MRTRRNRYSILLACGALLLGGLLFGCGSDSPDPMPRLDDSTRRTIALGDVVGGVSPSGAHAWRGIPFAAPPVGERRWRAPAAAEPWTGTLEAIEHPAPCPQFATFAGGPEGVGPGDAYGSEDCLYLNVFAPPYAPEKVPGAEKRLPVMLWIHGGGNSLGDASIYDGGRLATGRDVIVVAVQYRLGPFGWFRHEALRHDASPADASGNYGTLDLVEALRWVKTHIAAFGGDPDNVTVFGESAGGTNVFTMLLSPQASGLFHRAIVQSGSPGVQPGLEGEDPAADPRKSGNTSSEVVERLRADGKIADDVALADALRALTPAEILGAYVGERGLGMINMPKVFQDGFALPAEDPYQALAAGRYNQVPTILGTNRDEQKLFQVFSPELVQSAMGIPLWVRDWATYDRQAEYGTKWWKLAGVDRPARLMSAVQGGSVFAYRFDWDEEPDFLWLDFGRLLGAAHAFEIPFVFESFDYGPLTTIAFDESNETGRLQLSDQMTSYWTAFARSGDPGQGRDGSLPAWTAWDDSRPTAGRFLLLDTAADGGVRMSADALTDERILQQLAADPRFSGSNDRCELLEQIQARRGQLDKADFRLGGCVRD
jgi:para-nitrobenzyl esterase